MQRTVLPILAGFISALGIAFWLQPSSKSSIEAEAASGIASAARPDARAGLAEARLDDAFAAEVVERGALETRARENRSNPLALPFVDRERRDGATLRDQRLAVDLIVDGLAPDRAEWISRRVQELRMQAQYAARREGRPPPADVEAGTLRTGLGDHDYERYLVARRLPISVRIMTVLARSPAERAGMQRGDEIFSYDGKRVFNIQELNELALDGASGKSAVVDVRRNGQYFRFVLPRGPIGVRDGSDLAAPARGFER